MMATFQYSRSLMHYVSFARAITTTSSSWSVVCRTHFTFPSISAQQTDSRHSSVLNSVVSFRSACTAVSSPFPNRSAPTLQQKLIAHSHSSPLAAKHRRLHRVGCCHDNNTTSSVRCQNSTDLATVSHPVPALWPCSGQLQRGVHTSAPRRVILQIRDEADFRERVIMSALPVVVNFYADWCDPCHELTSMLEQMIGERRNIALCSLEIDNHVPLLMDFEVQAIPAVLAFFNGQVVDKFVGLVNRQMVSDFVARIVQRLHDHTVLQQQLSDMDEPFTDESPQQQQRHDTNSAASVSSTDIKSSSNSEIHTPPNDK